MKPRKERPKKEPRAWNYMGIDGEGQGRSRHDYVYLAASFEDGAQSWSVESTAWREAWNPEQGRYTGYVEQIPTRACLDFLLALPGDRTRCFSFAFNYDLTKLLEGLPDRKLYSLFRPELPCRKRSKELEKLGPKPIKWHEYKINLQGTKFTLTRGERRFLLWDIFKFYGCKFVDAIKAWKVGTPEMWAAMTTMKDKRGDFDKEPPADVERYCLSECRAMGELAHKLVDAHDAAGLELKAFYGAGSSGGAMLKRMNIGDQIREVPEAMRDPVAKAFFGGRFENSEIGAVREPVFCKDISSAYPYQTYFLPCLVHGTWTHTTRRQDLDGTRGLVRYGLAPHTLERAWGPFPFRTGDGSICYPSVSGGGWVYSDEYLAGEALFPQVYFREAWVYRTECACQPFKEIAQFYLYRIALGKEGAGIVVKLATNSVYGKIAQSIGSAPFNSWVWAGMITSGTRAQMLRVMALADDLGDILMIATDGLAARKPLPSPAPKDTGTLWLLNGDRNPKPLGGWEDKNYPQGLFLARPGIYFPMNPTNEDFKDVKGRGVGKGTILHHHERIVQSWEDHGTSRVVEVANIARFCGAKTSISRGGKPGEFRYTRADGTNGVNAPRYGNWIARSVEMSFDPMPKREGVNPDGRTLKVRKVSRAAESKAYSRAEISPDAAEMKAASLELLEQPDVDFSIYGDMIGVAL